MHETKNLKRIGEAAALQARIQAAPLFDANFERMRG